MIKQDVQVAVLMKEGTPIAVFDSSDLAEDFLKLIQKVSDNKKLTIHEADFWSE